MSAAGTTFTALKIGGIPVVLAPAPNTVISLPGIGSVTLNQQSSSVHGTSASLTVIAIHVNVTVANDVVPLGTQIIVSYATSRLGGPVAGLLSGLSYGTYANVGATLIAGRSFPEVLACQGTGGVTRTNSGAAVSVPGVVSSGTVTDTANGVDNATSVSGEMTATVQSLNLLGGTVTASVIKADVTAVGNPPTLGDKSTFVGLHVAGFASLTDNVAPNTKITLAGIGTLWLHKQIKTTTGITVIMVQLDVTVPGNPTGLAAGTTVNVAYAHVAVN